MTKSPFPNREQKSILRAGIIYHARTKKLQRFQSCLALTTMSFTITQN